MAAGLAPIADEGVETLVVVVRGRQAREWARQLLPPGTRLRRRPLVLEVRTRQPRSPAVELRVVAAVRATAGSTWATIVCGGTGDSSNGLVWHVDGGSRVFRWSEHDLTISAVVGRVWWPAGRLARARLARATIEAPPTSVLAATAGRRRGVLVAGFGRPRRRATAPAVAPFPGPKAVPGPAPAAPSLARVPMSLGGVGGPSR